MHIVFISSYRAYAREIGMPIVFLRTSPKSVCETFVRARDIAQLRRKEKLKVFHIKAIMESVYDGIIL
jgi:hypothetical protein